MNRICVSVRKWNPKTETEHCTAASTQMSVGAKTISWRTQSNRYTVHPKQSVRLFGSSSFAAAELGWTHGSRFSACNSTTRRSNCGIRGRRTWASSMNCVCARRSKWEGRRQWHRGKSRRAKWYRKYCWICLGSSTHSESAVAGSSRKWEWWDCLRWSSSASSTLWCCSPSTWKHCQIYVSSFAATSAESRFPSKIGKTRNWQSNCWCRFGMRCWGNIFHRDCSHSDLSADCRFVIPLCTLKYCLLLRFSLRTMDWSEIRTECQFFGGSSDNFRGNLSYGICNTKYHRWA